MIRYYKVLAGGGNEHTADFIDNQYFGIHYDVELDLSDFDNVDKDVFKQELIKSKPNAYKASNKLFRVYSEIKPGDVLLLFVKEKAGFQIGFVESDYIYNSGAIFPHKRKVNWTKFVSKDRMSIPLQNSATGPTVCASLEKHTAELSHLIFGTIWQQDEKTAESIIESDSKELTEVIEKTKTKHHIYVYTYNHYMLHPVRESSEDNPITRTYFKIGMTTKGYSERTSSQETTAFPEPILIRRAYALSDEDEMLSNEEKDYLIRIKEKAFHNLLENAGHTYSKTKSKQGKEWFLTNLSLLDSIAENIKMQQIELEN